MRTAALALAALLLTAAPAPATPIGALDEADQAAVEALALYDEATTRYALQAVTEADVLSDLVYQQERSRERFQQLLSPYQRDVQEQLFEITRYPELIAKIVEGGPKSSDELEAIAALYPEEARAAALAAGSSHWKVVARIDALLRDEAAWLEARIAPLPEAKREAFRGLVATPELMALLAENTALAVLLGDAYEREPETVLAWLAEVRHQAEEQSAAEAREFAQGVEDNPELAGEIEAATSAYQQETGYSAYQPVVVHNTFVNVRPYPYWVGYPWWYDVSYGYYAPWYYWYPRTCWAFGGFYFGPRLLVSFGLPHGGFWGWFFDRPIHHTYYPRVTHHVVQHYDRYYVNHHPGYWYRRPPVRYRHAEEYAVYRFRRDAERPNHEQGEKRARELVESKAHATGGGLDPRVPPPRQVKAERRSIRPEPGRAERSQPSERGSATRMARAEPAARPHSPQPRVEAKQRPAPQLRTESRRPQPPRQEARPAPRAPEPRQIQPKPPRRAQTEGTQPKARQAKREARKAVERVDPRSGGSHRRAR